MTSPPPSHRPNIEISVAPDVFAIDRGYRRAIVWASGIDNRASAPELTQRLEETQARVRERFSLETLGSEPRVRAWRDAFKAFGADPTKARPAVEALLRRLLKGPALRPISPLVDIGTIVSLAHALPCGAHSLDEVREELVLRRAVGDETFIPFGSSGPAERPEPGEVIFTDGSVVATRRWVWRQADHTSIKPETRSFELNIDALGVVSDAQLSDAIAEATQLLKQCLGVEASSYILTAAEPTVGVDRAPGEVIQ
jgi:DNA/RNA-binding domain of Phe-tRNA-synthetase-like protein